MGKVRIAGAIFMLVDELLAFDEAVNPLIETDRRVHVGSGESSSAHATK